MPSRERILVVTVKFITAVGMTLPAAYVVSIGLSEVSGYFRSSDVVGWMLDYASLISVPWEVIATVLVIVGWRELPQRFWIIYCINGLLAYLSFPIYRYHFGLFL